MPQLQFQGAKDPSVTSKTVIITWYLVCCTAAVWMTFFGARGEVLTGNTARQVLLLACGLLYVARAAVTFFLFMKRKVPWWEVLWGGLPIGAALFFFLWDGFRAPQPLGLVDLAGIVLYVTGSVLGTASEYSRHVWKSRPENTGHLYTEGLFSYSRHINYFGDLLLFLGFGILTQHAWTAFVPLVMGLNFIFFIIPAHDAYLAQRYGAEFEAYARRTRGLVPYLF